MAIAYNGVYSASKHALVGLSWWLRAELAGHGIGVSVVCPGFVSDQGRFARWSGGRKIAAVAKTVTPQQVAIATVRAIENNRAEATVVGGLGKLADVSFAPISGLATTIARRLGLYGFMRDAAVEAFKRSS